MIDVSDLRPLIESEVPQCPTPAIDAAIVRAARHLCEFGLVWEEVIDRVYLLPGDYQYDLSSDYDAQIVVIRKVMSGGRRLISEGEAQSSVDFGSSSGAPRIYGLAPSMCELLFWPTPVDRAQVIVTAFLKPKMSAQKLPIVVADHHAEAVVEGAKWFLMRSSGQPWSNQAEAGIAKSEFDKKVGQARIKTEAKRAQGSFMARPTRRVF